MASLKNIKLKILSVKKTSTVTRAMEAVSAVKMRKAQQRALGARPYASAAFQILRSLSHTTETKQHPLLSEGRKGKTAILVITSDKGLAGSFNSAVLKKVDNFIKGRALTTDDVIFLCLGKRGFEYASTRGYEVARHDVNISDDIDIEHFNSVTQQIVELFLAEKVSQVYAAYTNFKSVFEQHAQIHKILPLSEKIVEHIVEDMSFALARDRHAQAARAPSAFTIEPDADSVLAILLPLLVNVAIFHKLLESKASEHSARRVAMKNATDNAKERVKLYTRTFNKVRQAAITREISEITSGIEAMR